MEAAMTRFSSYDELSDLVTKSGNVLTVTMAELRDVNGSGRLGPYVVESISKALASRGIGHYPADLPQNQWESARLFRRGSAIADLYELLTNVNEDGDDKIREYTSDDAKERLSQVRKNVCY